MTRRTSSEPGPVDGARWVALTRGRFALVDAADFDDVNQLVWCHVNTGTGYAVTNSGDAQISMHRWIMGAPDGVEVDHVNRDGLDNRRSNLRFATVRQNMVNKASRNRYGYKGIRFDAKYGGRWYASIRIDGARTHLGVWPTAEDAARAYDRAARQHHGAFARYNFPEPGEQAA